MVLQSNLNKGNNVKGLFLPGYACNNLIWKQIKNDIKNKFDGNMIEWPQNKTHSFHDLNDYVNWVVENYLTGNNIEYIVGHSMGGLVALKLSKKINTIKKLILIESFIKTPSNYFHNIVSKTTPEPTKKEILNMLVKESNYYSEKLKNKLKEHDYSYYVRNLDSKIYLIYGDRGDGDLKKVMKELLIGRDVLSQVNIKTISNACHFPMVENPEETIEALEILN